MSEVKNIIEALLFAADTPLSVERIKDVLDEDADMRTVRSACQALRSSGMPNEGA